MFNSSESNIFKYNFFFIFNSHRMGKDSVRKKFIRTDFLSIDYKGRKCLHKIGAFAHHFDFKSASKLFFQINTFLYVDAIRYDLHTIKILSVCIATNEKY